MTRRMFLVAVAAAAATRRIPTPALTQPAREESEGSSGWHCWH